MPYPELKAILTDIGTEELAHMEMVGTIVHQLTRNLTEKQLKEGNFGAYFVNHTVGVLPLRCDRSSLHGQHASGKRRPHHRYPRRHGSRAESALYL
jgi:Mn-containing catalase